MLQQGAQLGEAGQRRGHEHVQPSLAADDLGEDRHEGAGVDAGVWQLGVGDEADAEEAFYWTRYPGW